jgi:HK97 family phage prohead protease
MADVVRQKQIAMDALTDEGTFRAYLSTYGNVDRDGDIIQAGAFDGWLAQSNIAPMCLNHDRDDVLGRLDLASDAQGLITVGNFDMDDPDAVKWHRKIKMRAVTSMSVGMLIKRWQPIDPDRPYGGWYIIEAEILEGSIVTAPANTQARIIDVKSYEDGMAEQRAAAAKIEEAKARVASRIADALRRAV